MCVGYEAPNPFLQLNCMMLPWHWVMPLTQENGKRMRCKNLMEAPVKGLGLTCTCEADHLPAPAGPACTHPKGELGFTRDAQTSRKQAYKPLEALKTKFSALPHLEPGTRADMPSFKTACKAYMNIRQGLKICFNVSIKTSYVKHAVHMKGACQRKPLTLCLQAKTLFPQVESTFNELMSSTTRAFFSTCKICLPSALTEL